MCICNCTKIDACTLRLPCLRRLHGMVRTGWNIKAALRGIARKDKEMVGAKQLGLPTEATFLISFSESLLLPRGGSPIYKYSFTVRSVTLYSEKSRSESCSRRPRTCG